MSTKLPEPVPARAGRFDPVTGSDTRPGLGSGNQRKESYALQSGEPVFSFNLVTSMLPLAGGNAPQTYRWAMVIGVLIPVVAAALGFLAFAFVAAALVVPIIYVVYMYDVNQWEDQPVPVVLGTMGLAAVLGVAFTFGWHGLILGDTVVTAKAGVDWKALLVFCLLVPIVAQLLAQIGPIVLASRPAFDDMIDGLTFGVASGAAFAAAETIVENRSLFGSIGHVADPNAGFWISLILSAAVVKPIVYGAAVGIAVAAYSGLGEGYDGFKPGYVRGLVEALIANIVYQGGLFVAAKVGGTEGAIIGLIWGVLIAGALLIRLRYLLHFAVLEAAQEAAGRGATLKDTVLGTAHCPSCRLPMEPGDNFCEHCGTSARIGSKVTRRRNREDDGGNADATLEAPRDEKTMFVVLGSIAAVLLVAGFVGQAAAAAASDGNEIPDVDIQISPDLSGGTTEPPPTPAPAPGPTPDAQVSPSASGAAFHPMASHQVSGQASRAVLVPHDDIDGDGTDDTGTSSNGSGSGAVQLSGNVAVAAPSNWELQQVSETEAYAKTDGGYFNVLSVPATTDDQTMLTSEADYVAQKSGFEQVSFNKPESVTPPTAAVVSGTKVLWKGVTASQQGGAQEVDGFIFVFTRQDGSGIIMTGGFLASMLDESGGGILDDYDKMVGYIIANLS